MHLILASASPRRADLLKAAGWDFEVRAAELDERPRSKEAPADYVRRLASEKARAVWTELEGLGRGSRTDLVVLGADTAVVVDGDILGKPRDDQDARQMLLRLGGRAHEVLTGVAVRTVDREVGHVERTTVSFTPLSESEVAWYISTGEGRDKAGGYGIQGLASRFVEEIRGFCLNVIGLPVEAVFDILNEYRRSQKSL